ncbi:MAG: ABC transporter permease [Syntrophomonadaceae bacterium]|nr:ABC transporter permease [Syntrophomonadaceae bacterium]
MLKEILMMALDNIIGNKMRSFLTMLGIMIGVTSIIALITVVQGVTGEVIDRFSEMGAGKVTVQAYGTALKAGLNENDIADLSAIEYVSGVSPTVSLGSTAVRNNKIFEDISVEGNNEIYFENNQDMVIQGRPLNIYDMSGYSNVCIIDENIADELFWGENPINKQMYLSGQNYTVVGLMESETNFYRQNVGRVKIPYKNALSLNAAANIMNIEIYLYDANETQAANYEIENVLNAAFNYAEDSFNIVNFESILSSMQEMQSMLTAMLTGIASIALLVGGVGIMNMMLVSVTERTTEIGLRKALGAEPRQIQYQFVIEAVLLSLLGGLFGALFGLLISYIASAAMDTKFALSPTAIALGLGFSALVGIVFGWAPARKASRLKPIDALRSE